MAYFIVIDTSNAPDNYLVHLVKSDPTVVDTITDSETPISLTANGSNPISINGGIKILKSTKIESWDKVVETVEAAKKSLKLTDKHVLRRNVRFSVGEENYGGKLL